MADATAAHLEMQAVVEGKEDEKEEEGEFEEEGRFRHPHDDCYCCFTSPPALTAFPNLERLRRPVFIEMERITLIKSIEWETTSVSSPNYFYLYIYIYFN